MMQLTVWFLLVACFPSLASSWSPQQSRVVVTSKDDFKSSQPLTSQDTNAWIPWSHGEVDSQEETYNMEEHIASEYRKWTKLHNKKADARHFEAFKRNYLDLLDESEEGHGGSGPVFQLNQYGDMTQEEHRREMLCLEAYYSWCQEYNKRQDPQRFQAFKLNLLQAVLQSSSSSRSNESGSGRDNALERGREIHLDEFADCNPHSQNHCVEPFGFSSVNGGPFLPNYPVQEIGHGVYIDGGVDNTSSSGHYDSHDDSPETFPALEEPLPPAFLETMQHQKWQQGRNDASPYSNFHP